MYTRYSIIAKVFMHVCYSCLYASLGREFERLKVICEESKTKYGDLELKATKAAEDLKHLANKVCVLL